MFSQILIFAIYLKKTVSLKFTAKKGKRKFYPKIINSSFIKNFYFTFEI